MADTKQAEKEFESVTDVARRIGKCYRTVHRAVQAGKIKSIRFGGSLMIPRREVEKILERGF